MAGPALRRAGFALACALALAGCGGGAAPEARLNNPYPASSPLHASAESFVQGFNEDEALRKRFGPALIQNGLHAEIGVAMRRGAQALETRQLDAATIAMKRAITAMDDRDCAAFFRGNAKVGVNDRYEKAFERIPPQHHQNLMDFYLAALKAEVARTPAKPVDRELLQLGMKHLGEQYQGRFAERIDRTLSNPGAASDTDLCWAFNSMFNGVEKLGDRERDAMLRDLWAGKGG